MSSETPKWTALPTIGNSGLVDFRDLFAQIEENNQRIAGVLSTVERLANIILPFFGSLSDITAILIKGFAKAFQQILSEIRGAGGQFILIHPYNSVIRRTTNIGGVSPLELKIPSLSPREAFSEFAASFNNTSDTSRPQWAATSTATGVGLLLTAPNPEGLANLMNVFAQVTAIADFQKMPTKIAETTEAFKQDIKIQGLTSEWQESATVTSGTIQSISREAKFIGSQGAYYAAKQATIALRKKGTELKWHGLTLGNVPFIKETLDYLDKFAESLYKMSDGANNAIQDTIQAIFTKIKNLQNLITEIYNMLVRVTQTIEATGVYLIQIPPAVGGTGYITSSIESALASSKDPSIIQLRQSLDSIKFSAFFFMGAAGPTATQWSNLFYSVWNTAEAQLVGSIGNTAIQLSEEPTVQSLSAATLQSLKRWLASGGTPINENTIIPKDKSLSIGVIPPINQTDPLTFSFSAKDGETGSSLRSFTSSDTNKAVAGISSFAVPMSDSIALTLSTPSSTYIPEAIDLAFALRTSPFLSAPLSTVANETPFNVNLPSSFIGTIYLYRKTARGEKFLVEKQVVYQPQGPIPVGITLSTGNYICSMVIAEQGQELSEEIDLAIDSTVVVREMNDSIFDTALGQAYMYVPAFPVRFKLVSNKYTCFGYESTSGLVPHEYVPIPGSILVEENKTFVFSVFDGRSWRSGMKTLFIIQKVTGFSNIC